MTKEYDCMKKKNIIAICAALVILGMATVLVLTEIEEMYQMSIVLLVTPPSMVKIQSMKHLMS